MSNNNFISNLPFITINNNKLVLKNCTIPQVMPFSLNTNDPLCNDKQLQRQTFIVNVNSNLTRTTIFPGPYPEYTSNQLNIRRKAEILKYNKNSSNLTNKMSWKNLNFNQLKNKRVCLNNNNLVVSSTRSDIPKPIVDLTLNPNIPLYLYKNTNNFNKISEIDNKSNKVVVNDSTNVNIFGLTTIASLSFLSENFINFYISLPFSITISGKIDSSSDTTKIKITLSSIELKIYDIINKQYIDSISIEDPISSDLIPLEIQKKNSGVFEANLYIGNINIYDINFMGLNQYSYDLQIQETSSIVQTNVDGLPSSNPTKIFTSLCFNPVDDGHKKNTLYFANNCDILSPRVDYSPFSLIVEE